MASVTTGALVLAGGLDLSCVVKSIEISAEQDVLDSTALCATSARTFTQGLAMRSVKGEGFFSYNSTTPSLGVDTAFNNSFSATANKQITIGANGFSAVGDPAMLINTKQASLSTTDHIGELIMFSFEAKATDDNAATVRSYADGVFLMSATQTGTVNGSSYDSTSGGTGYLAHVHVTDSVSLSSCVVKIQHSTNNSVWSDLVTFTTATGNTGEQKYNTATSVNRYVRAIVSSFSGTSAKVSVAMKIGYTG